MTTQRRPPFDPATSDGCSVPKALRLVIPVETPAQRRVCVAHDGAYYAGGTRQQRVIADAHLLVGLLEADMEYELAEKYWAGVRLGGRSHWGPDGCHTDDPPVNPKLESPEAS